MRSTPFNLVMSALYNGKKGARRPVGNATSIACHDLMEASGVFFLRAIEQRKAALQPSGA